MSYCSSHKIIFTSAIIILSGMIMNLRAVTISNLIEDGKPLLIPEVQKIEFGTNRFSLPKVLTVNMTKESLNTENLEIEFKRRGIRLEEGENAFLQLKIQPDILPGKPEGYLLEAGTDGIHISANSRAGLFYGIQTLADLLRNSEELQECRIQDYPALKMRGVYLNLRGLRSGQITAFKNVMTFLAGLKFNTLFLEFADNFPYESVTFQRKFLLSKSDILAIKQHADDLHIEIIPLLQCLSHVSWMSGYPDFDGILESQKGKAPDKSWNAAWCPQKPEVQNLIANLIKETTVLLHPRYFHLGLDEVNYGPFRECDLCKPIPAEKLFEDQVRKLEKYAKQNQVIPIFYHDTFLPQSMNGNLTDKAKGDRVADKLSKDTIINVWDYSGEPRINWTSFFTDRKLSVIGASYCENMRNVQTLPQLMAGTPDALGCILLYWHYINGGLLAPQTDSHLAVAATVLAANYSWKPDAVPIEKILFDPVYEYARRYSQAPEPFPGNSATVSPVNLAPHVNFQFGQNELFPLYTSTGLNQVAAELSELPEKFTLLKKDDGRYYGILLSGSKTDNLDISREIALNGKAKRLAFLMMASRPENMDLFARWDQVKLQPEVGKLVINYSDGSKSEIPLKYNGNIIDWNAAWGGYKCRIVNRSNDKRNALCQLAVVDWINPGPDKPIKSISFSTTGSQGIMPVLLAISASGDTVEQPVGALPEVCRNSIPVAAQTRNTEVNIAGISGKKLVPTPELSGFGYNQKIKIAESPQEGPNHSPSLKITIPPLAKGADIGRVNFDYTIPGHSGFNALRIYYRLLTPLHLKQSGVYLMNADRTNYISKFSILDDNAGEWQELIIPVSSMSRETAEPIRSEEAGRLRIALWLNNHETAILQLGRITGINKIIVIQHPLRNSLVE